MSEENPVDVTDAQASEGAQSTDRPASESAPQDQQTDASESDPKASDEDRPRESGAKKRIDKLTRDKWDAHQARQAAEQRANELEQRLSQLQSSRAQPTDKGPSEADFTDWNEYQDARAEWKANQAVEKALSAQRQADAHKSQREQQQSQVREFIVRAENLAAELPDFNQVAGGIQLDGAFGGALMQSEQSAAVAYFLGANPAELMRIESIRDPVRAAIEIGRIEAKAATFVQSRSKSRAPAQAKPLSSGGRAQGPGFSASDSMDEFARKWRERK